MDFLTIDNEAALRQFCQQIRGSAWLALDTEFERVSTYYPELCLLQVANLDVAAVIDPLAIARLDPLYELIYNPAITKVFHSARQDLEIMFNLKGAIPVPVFDTQIAAPLLGYDQGIGYGNLIRELLGVDLNKGHTRTNWKRRPLNAGQLRYAADDVIYLAQAYALISARLADKDLLSGLQNEFAALADPKLYVPDPQEMWQKIRAARKFSGSKLAVLQELAAWREMTARTENKPRKWVVQDHVILEMARVLPENQAALAQIDGMEEGVLRRHGAALLKIIEEFSLKEPKGIEKQGAC